MKPSDSRLMRAWTTWATDAAMATPVASSTRSVAKYTARNMMVEKKSVASFANTVFIDASLGCGCQVVGTAPAAAIPYLAFWCSGYHLVK